MVGESEGFRHPAHYANMIFWAGKRHEMLMARIENLHRIQGGKPTALGRRGFRNIGQPYTNESSLRYLEKLPKNFSNESALRREGNRAARWLKAHPTRNPSTMPTHIREKFAIHANAL